MRPATRRSMLAKMVAEEICLDTNMTGVTGRRLRLVTLRGPVAEGMRIGTGGEGRI